MDKYNTITKCFIVISILLVGFSCKKQKLNQESDKEIIIKVEGPQDYITQSDFDELGLHNQDATMPFVRLGENDYWIYLSEGGKDDGKHSNINRVRTTLTDIDKSRSEKVSISGIPDANVNNYNGWKAWIMSLYEIDSDEWLAITHLEDQDFGTTEDYRMGAAYSDDGKSFQHLGFILETEIDSSIIKSGICTGKCNISGGGLRWDDTYLYIYFNDYNEPDKSDRHGAVARAEIATVVENARKGKNTLWHKYYDGKWNEHGMGGRSADIGKTGNHTTMMYNTYINKWLTFNRRGSTITMCKTSDPLNFNGVDEIIYELPNDYKAAYFTIVPDQPDTTTCGKEFYLYYRYWFKKKKEYNIARLKISFE